MNVVIEKYLPIIKKYYPECNVDDMTLLDDGHDHYVLLVDNLHAFRFPRTEFHGKNDHVENVFLKSFARMSPIAVQLMTGHLDDGVDYQTYEFIAGTKLSKELASTLSQEELTSIAKDMGKFLTALHSFPVSEAKDMKMVSLVSSQDYGQYFKEIIKKDRELTFHLLTREEQQWIEQLVEKFVALTEAYPFELKTTHSDMLPEHIIIDSKTHGLNGVIDFSLRIADPANDFKFFDRYGQVFLKTVYENYPQVDEHFDKRREFYAGNLPVANLYQSIERNDEKKLQEFYLKELKDYINSNSS